MDKNTLIDRMTSGRHYPPVEARGVARSTDPDVLVLSFDAGGTVLRLGVSRAAAAFLAGALHDHGIVFARHSESSSDVSMPDDGALLPSEVP